MCLFGSSNGASVALALAAALQDKLTINYLCLADLPMFAGGRSPGIPGVGDCAVFPPYATHKASSVQTLGNPVPSMVPAAAPVLSVRPGGLRVI